MAIKKRRAISKVWRPVGSFAVLSSVLYAMWLVGCSQNNSQVDGNQAGGTLNKPEVVYDTTAPKPVAPRDTLERWVKNRWADLKLIDKLLDKRTAPPEFDRKPLPPLPANAQIAVGVPLLDDRNPFPESIPIAPKEATLYFGVARSTFRTREREEVLSAIQPLIDLIQREANVRGAPFLCEKPEEIYFALLDGKAQMVVSHVFDYLLVRSWFASLEDNGVVLLAWAQPANPRTTELDRNFIGAPGASVELVVAKNSPYQKIADLKGARLSLPAYYINAPGTFLTRMLIDLRHPLDEPFFSKVRLRRFSKDAVIDLFKDKADVACVDRGTVGAMDRFYGITKQVRTLTVSPRYNMDVLYTSLNNVATHRTQIEMTQNQLTTLGKNPEGQEVLFFFDTKRWYNHRAGDITVPRENFADFLMFIDQTPVDLKPLFAPETFIDRQTYDRFGDQF